MLTMVLAIVPFAGAAAVWVPTAIWIYLYQPVPKMASRARRAASRRRRRVCRDCLAIFGVCVVSAIDNVIKPLVLHGQSNLHPLVALISILGGVQTLGPIGILVGPMLVAFVQALLNMVNKELLRFGDATLQEKHGARATPLLAGEPATRASGSGSLGRAAATDNPGELPPKHEARPAGVADRRAPHHAAHAVAGRNRRRRRGSRCVCSDPDASHTSSATLPILHEPYLKGALMILNLNTPAGARSAEFASPSTSRAAAP